MACVPAGLFHQAICESGTEMSLWAYTDPLQNPAEFAKDVADQLECPTEPSQALVDCLRTKNASVLVSTDPAPSVSLPFDESILNVTSSF